MEVLKDINRGNNQLAKVGKLFGINRGTVYIPYTNGSNTFPQRFNENVLLLALFVEPSVSSVQALDVGYFASLKAMKNSFRKDCNLNKQTDEIRKICNAYQATGTPDRISGAFSQLMPLQMNILPLLISTMPELSRELNINLMNQIIR